MSQQLTRLIPQLSVPVRPVHRRLRNPEGSYGRLKRLRCLVASLVHKERLLGNFNGLDEARPYAERLICEAIRHGDNNAHMMDQANFWLPDKRLVYKLFQVLAPRFADSNRAYTRIFFLPEVYRTEARHRSHYDTVLELKGHPFPDVVVEPVQNRDAPHMLHNLLLDAARKELTRQRYEQILKESRAAIQGRVREANAASAIASPSLPTPAAKEEVAERGEGGGGGLETAFSSENDPDAADTNTTDEESSGSDPARGTP